MSPRVTVAPSLPALSIIAGLALALSFGATIVLGLAHVALRAAARQAKHNYEA